MSKRKRRELKAAWAKREDGTGRTLQAVPSYWGVVMHQGRVGGKKAAPVHRECVLPPLKLILGLQGSCSGWWWWWWGDVNKSAP